MNKKMMWGIFIMFIGLFYILRGNISESILKYIFNYQVVLIIFGINLLFEKSKVMGYILVGGGIYLYLQEFFGVYFDFGFPTIVLGVGVFIFISGLKEKRAKKSRELKKYKKDDVIEAEEIK